MIFNITARDINVSDRKMLKMAAQVQKALGRTGIEKKFKDTLTSTKSSMKDFFDQIWLPFDVKNHGERVKMLPFTFCSDMEGLINFVAQKFDITDLSENVIGMDGGKNILKMIWYIPKYPPVVIGAVPDATESYKNCALFFNHIKIAHLNFKFSSDLKLGMSITLLLL